MEPLDILYNIASYIRTQLPEEKLYVDGWNPKSENNSSNLTQFGGEVAHQFLRQDVSVQIESRATSRALAKTMSYKFYRLLFNRIHLTIDPVTVNNILYPGFLAAQISPMQIPGCIGTDGERLHLYSVNFSITVGG